MTILTEKEYFYGQAQKNKILEFPLQKWYAINQHQSGGLP